MTELWSRADGQASERAFADVVAWAWKELAGTDFNEVRLTFIVHGGRLARVEKTVTTKELPGSGTANARLADGQT